MNRWTKIGDFDAEGIYDASWGFLKDGTIVEDQMNNITKVETTFDKKTHQLHIKNGNFEKAVNVGSASGSAGYAFVPIVYDRDIVDITRKFTPLLTLIPKVTNRGKAAYYFRITARGAASWGSEDPALDESDDTGESANTAIKFCRINGRVSGVAQVAGTDFTNALQVQVLNKTQSLNETLEEALLVGDSSVNSLQPDGLTTQIDGVGSTVDLATADLELADVRDIVSQCYMKKGAPNMIVTDAYTYDRINNLMMDFVRYTDISKTIAWGFETLAMTTVVGKVPIIPSQFMPTTSGSRKLLVVNTNYLQQRILQDITFERLAKTSDSEKFMLKTYRTLVNKFPEGMGIIKNIA